MKTNRSARTIRKLQMASLGLAIAAFTALAFTAGDFLAVRVGQANVRQNQLPQAPNFDLAILVASMR